MNKNSTYHKIAKVMTLIPVIVFAVTATCLLMLTISYLITGSDVTAIAVIIALSAILIFTTLPCLALAVVGTVFAAMSLKEGIAASRKFLVAGIIEIVVYSIAYFKGRDFDYILSYFTGAPKTIPEQTYVTDWDK